MNNPTAQQDEDTASGRKITNSRITIRNLTYTAPPQGGFPHPQITKPVTAGQSPQAIKLFNELPGYKIWVRPWAMRFTKDLHLPRQEINKTMMDFFDREPDNHLSLTQPSPDKAHENEADGSPWGFLISSISKAEHDMAIRTGVIASKQAILFISPYEQQIPSFVMMIMGISFDEGRINEAKTAVVEAFQRTLTTNPIISQTLMNLIEDPSQVHVEFEAFLAGITATHTPLPESSMIYWCIKSNNMPNFLSIEDYNNFITSFVNFQFFAGQFGTGEAPKRGDNFSCNLCKSREHHTSYCSYPAIPGWLSPPDTAFPWTDPAKRKTNRGGKGRGGPYRGQSSNRRNF